MKSITTICVLSLATAAHADFTSIDLLSGFSGVGLNLAVSDFMGNGQSDTTFEFAPNLSDYPKSLSNEIQTPFGVTGGGSALIEIGLDSPTSVSASGLFTGSANTFGVQGAAQGGASGGVFLGFTLDAAAQVQMDWSLTDSMLNNANDLGLLRLYEMNTMGPVLLEFNQDGNGLNMSGTELLDLAQGRYVLSAFSDVTVNANEFDSLIEASSGFDVGFTIVPAPASMLLLGAGVFATSRRRL